MCPPVSHRFAPEKHSNFQEQSSIGICFYQKANFAARTMGTNVGIRTAILVLGGVAWWWCVLAAGEEEERVFNVVDYGARGDGCTDDTKAFRDAWNATCGGGAGGSSASLLVPAGMSFLVGPTVFNGPCASTRITVQVLGMIVAPPATASAWSGESIDYWLMFYEVDGLTVTGRTGVFDGKGRSWWARKCRHDACINVAPTTLKLMKCNNLEVSYLRSNDSPQMHIAIGMSRNVTLTQLAITAPADSPNTDGVHIDRCEDVQITGSVIGTGDDCVSIGSGSRFVTVDNITCGPGHGVSVGSLGKGASKASVVYIDVKNVHFINTQNGVRIKTWEGGEGYARSMSFSNIEFTNVQNPVVINQFYRDGVSQIKGIVEISNITYSDLRGTSSKQTAVAFDCSQSGSCTGIHVKSMEITGSDGQETVARCQNAQGDTSGYVYPKIACLG